MPTTDLDLSTPEGIARAQETLEAVEDTWPNTLTQQRWTREVARAALAALADRVKREKFVGEPVSAREIELAMKNDELQCRVFELEAQREAEGDPS